MALLINAAYKLLGFLLCPRVDVAQRRSSEKEADRVRLGGSLTGSQRKLLPNAEIPKEEMAVEASGVTQERPVGVTSKPAS
jgi:hypothetical protein